MGVPCWLPTRHVCYGAVLCCVYVYEPERSLAPRLLPVLLFSELVQRLSQCDPARPLTTRVRTTTTTPPRVRVVWSRERQLVAIRVPHVEIALTPWGIARGLEAGLLAETGVDGIHIFNEDHRAPPSPGRAGLRLGWSVPARGWRRVKKWGDGAGVMITVVVVAEWQGREQ